MLQDKIGRQDIVNKICALIDNLQKDNHFCLALDGVWGSGKSFVMDMIDEKLRSNEKNIIIKYDAWKNSFYNDPLIAILSCVIDGLDGYLINTKQTKNRIQRTVQVIDNTLSSISSEYSIILNAIKGIKDIIGILKNPIDTKQLGDYKSYQKILDDTINVLNELTTGINDGEKIIVLVDEIDRCLPNEQLLVLERLHHLFDVKNCAVVCALNRSAMSETIKHIYGTDSEQYFSKFFDFTFALKTQSNDLVKSLLDELANKCATVCPTNCQIAINAAYTCLCNDANNVFNRINNREIIRYYNALENVCNDFGWEHLVPHYIFFIILALFFRRNITHNFLEQQDVGYNQEICNNKGNDAEEPYYDYVYAYLGLDRANNQIKNYRDYEIPHYIWCFNEIVYYSYGGEFNFNELRLFVHHPPTVHSADCQKLRELIIFYGGEQKQE